MVEFEKVFPLFSPFFLFSPSLRQISHIVFFYTLKAKADVAEAIKMDVIDYWSLLMRAIFKASLR